MSHIYKRKYRLTTTKDKEYDKRFNYTFCYYTYKSLS